MENDVAEAIAKLRELKRIYERISSTTERAIQPEELFLPAKPPRQESRRNKAGETIELEVTPQVSRIPGLRTFLNRIGRAIKAREPVRFLEAVAVYASNAYHTPPLRRICPPGIIFRVSIEAAEKDTPEAWEAARLEWLAVWQKAVDAWPKLYAKVKPPESLTGNGAEPKNGAPKRKRGRPVGSATGKVKKWHADVMALKQNEPTLSGAEVARRVGVSPSTLSEWSGWQRVKNLSRQNRETLSGNRTRKANILKNSS